MNPTQKTAAAIGAALSLAGIGTVAFVSNSQRQPSIRMAHVADGIEMPSAEKSLRAEAERSNDAAAWLLLAVEIERTAGPVPGAYDAYARCALLNGPPVCARRAKEIAPF